MLNHKRPNCILLFWIFLQPAAHYKVAMHAEQSLIWVNMSSGNHAALELKELFLGKAEGDVMGDIAQFIAMPIDRTDQGLVAGEPFKCASPASAIERAKGYWKIFGHAGAVAFVRTGYPETQTTVLRRFGNVPDELEIR